MSPIDETGAELGDGGESVDSREEGEDEPGDGGGLLPTVRRRHVVRLGHVVGVLLLLAFVVPFVLYSVPQLVGAEHSYVVLSGSMEPTLHPADVTFVDEVEPAAIEAGDIINFMEGGDTTTTTHRVVEVVQRDGELAFRTMGDNNQGPDPGVVTLGEFRGRVMTVAGVPLAIPLVGYLIRYAGTPTGFSLLFVVPVSLLVANEVWGVVSAARAAPEAKEPTADGGPAPDEGEARETASESASESAAADATADDAGGGIAFRPNELRLGVAILVVFVAYSAWVAVSDPTVVTIGVTGSAVVALLMLGGLYVLGTATSTSDGSGDGATEPAAETDTEASNE